MCLRSYPKNLLVLFQKEFQCNIWKKTHIWLFLSFKTTIKVKACLIVGNEFADVVIKRKLVQIVTLIASRSNWFCMVCPIEMWNRFYVLKFNFRCQIWNACRSQIRVVIWKLDLTNDIYWIRYKNGNIYQTILSH